MATQLKRSKYFQNWKNRKYENEGEQRMLERHKLFIMTIAKYHIIAGLETKLNNLHIVISFSQVANDKI